jgi:uncharacterized protein with PQ loop repeat
MNLNVFAFYVGIISGILGIVGFLNQVVRAIISRSSNNDSVNTCGRVTSPTLKYYLESELEEDD